MKRRVEFKSKSYGGDWQIAEGDYFDLESAAEDIAEADYYSDPGDAYRFSFDVEVRFIGEETSEKFRVTAEYSVDFCVRAIQ